MANNNWTIPIRIGSLVTHFRLPPYDIIEPPGNPGILLSVPTLQAPDFSLRSSCAASTERLLEIIPYRTEYTVKRVDEVVWHPHLVTQDQFTQVPKKVSDIPAENFTINIKLFRQTFTNVELLRQNWIVSKVTSPGRKPRFSNLLSDALPLRHTLFCVAKDIEGQKVAAELYLCSQMSHRAQSYEMG